MGESSGGEGGGRRPTTAKVAAALAAECSKDNRPVSSISVQFVTEGLYAVEVLERGSAEPERFFLTHGARGDLSAEPE
jgi:hypothetical protein